jgi:hypothetical protein
MKVPRACARGLLTHTRRKIIKKDLQGARGGGSQNCYLPVSYCFCDLKPRAKFHYPRTTPSGRKVCGTERKEKNNTKYSGHFVPQQRPRAAHALCSHQCKANFRHRYRNDDLLCTLCKCGIEEQRHIQGYPILSPPPALAPCPPPPIGTLSPPPHQDLPPPPSPKLAVPPHQDISPPPISQIFSWSFARILLIYFHLLYKLTNTILAL